jgi:hypothetical protein
LLAWLVQAVLSSASATNAAEKRSQSAAILFIPLAPDFAVRIINGRQTRFGSLGGGETVLTSRPDVTVSEAINFKQKISTDGEN